jgi:hypothetical protein
MKNKILDFLAYMILYGLGISLFIILMLMCYEVPPLAMALGSILAAIWAIFRLTPI